MSTILDAPPDLDQPAKTSLAEWWPVLVSLLAIFVPTYYRLANGAWNTEEQSHGPMVLWVVLWIFWQKRAQFLLAAQRTQPVVGSALLVFGLLLYVVGRSQGVSVFETGSQIPVLMGVLLILNGAGSVRRFWFPLLFLLFMIPLPGFVLDALTGPLKQQVSAIVESLLFSAGYPVARSGVLLTIGSYQLLVADACSGLHSMYSLSAMGLLYMYIVRRTSWWRNGLLLSAILPIAFFANILRVLVLVLVTYYFGDEAGQGFLHGFASIALFIFALSSLLVLDALLGLLWFKRTVRAP